MASTIIAGIEALAAIFYFIAFVLFIKVIKKESVLGRIITIVVIVAMFLGMAISLMDVLEWIGVSVILVENLEEIFTPIFGVCWLIASLILLITSHVDISR